MKEKIEEKKILKEYKEYNKILSKKRFSRYLKRKKEKKHLLNFEIKFKDEVRKNKLFSDIVNGVWLQTKAIKI
jgi:hypothetical protein